jgi:alkaline phosphatase
MLLLILRLLYIEERKKVSQTGDVVVIVDQVYDKYNMLKMQNKLDKTTLRNSMGLFRRYHLIQNLDRDISNPDTRVIIYPSILLAVANSSLDDMYQAAKDKLDKYGRGGEDRADSSDDEETDED